MTEILTATEIALMLRVSRQTIYRLLNGHLIPGAFRLGETGAWRIGKDGLDEYLNRYEGLILKKDT